MLFLTLYVAANELEWHRKARCYRHYLMFLVFRKDVRSEDMTAGFFFFGGIHLCIVISVSGGDSVTFKHLHRSSGPTSGELGLFRATATCHIVVKHLHFMSSGSRSMCLTKWSSLKLGADTCPIMFFLSFPIIFFPGSVHSISSSTPPFLHCQNTLYSLNTQHCIWQ